ncbi:uncharacterized protein Pyn_38760 [Prunus yedoensis var. nudiflora]|uniref:Ubiquitin-like protease family profile domain-containing protein n=1 Tax=Prunus yedoensis var. nudiflora TaxID=2094558 RepID=A0A314USU0_PRUYE|nr:uncharacterized protein Pyn_38760 [Prunus yedoensis var. nudiflora]
MVLSSRFLQISCFLIAEGFGFHFRVEFAFRLLQLQPVEVAVVWGFSPCFSINCSACVPGEEINFQHYKRIVGSGFIERRLADYKDVSKRVLEEQILRVVKLHGSVEESDFVRLEIKAKDETSAPTKGTKIIEIISNSGGKTSETPIKSIDDFDPIKAFQLLPTQLMECSQEEPSNSKVDIYDMQRKLQEVTTMLDVECSKNKDLFTENERLKKEIAKLHKGKGKDESPEQRSMILRTRARTRQPLVRPEYAYADKLGKTNCKKMKVHHGYTCEAKPIGVRRLRVGKCLSLHEADILKKYLDANNPMDAFWHGVRSAVYRKDALQLLNEEAVSIQELMKCRDDVGKVAVYVEVVLKNLRDNDLLFIPIIHVKEEHFTLLVLNKQSGWWDYYNNLHPNDSTTADPYLDDALKLQAKITSHFHFTKSSVHTILQKNEIWKHMMRRGEVVTQQSNLTQDDRELLTWLTENCVDYPMRSNTECPQQNPLSGDAGVAVMYMIQTLSGGKALENVFPTGEMKNMRAHVLGKFINDEDGCWNAYRIN